MSYLQVRLNYNCQGDPSALYRELLAPLQQAWARRYFYRWTLAKSWQNGRHVLLTLDCDDFFFEPRIRDEAELHATEFLTRNPSASYDRDRHIATQNLLNELEGAGVDPSWVAPNNTCAVSWREMSELARKYEMPAQWQSVFTTETGLRPLLIRECLSEAGHERFVCELLTLLACIYPPVASDEAGIAQYNGFLSYYSHFHLWHQRLPSAQQCAVETRFAAGYERDRDRYLEWWREMDERLERREAGLRELASVLLGAFLTFTQMATAGTIHDRSPYARDGLAPRESVPEFHQRLFYAADGSPYRFGPQFAAYRWLLNIIYRNLPLLDISPFTRHYFNFCLYELQRERLDLIERLRARVLEVM